MYDVVKLILICQIKDDLIPQLMPLIWVNSVIISLYILLMLVNNYYYSSNNINYCYSKNDGIKIIIQW